MTIFSSVVLWCLVKFIKCLVVFLVEYHVLHLISYQNNLKFGMMTYFSKVFTFQLTGSSAMWKFIQGHCHGQSRIPSLNQAPWGGRGRFWCRHHLTRPHCLFSRCGTPRPEPQCASQGPPAWGPLGLWLLFCLGSQTWHCPVLGALQWL